MMLTNFQSAPKKNCVPNILLQTKSFSIVLI